MLSGSWWLQLAWVGSFSRVMSANGCQLCAKVCCHALRLCDPTTRPWDFNAKSVASSVSHRRGFGIIASSNITIKCWWITAIEFKWIAARLPTYTTTEFESGDLNFGWSRCTNNLLARIDYISSHGGSYDRIRLLACMRVCCTCVK